MKNYHTVAFDLDGTLSDPKRGLTSAFAYALSKSEVRFGKIEDLTKFIGPPLRDSFKEEYGLTEEQADTALDLFREYYSVYGWWDNELYRGVHGLLAELKAAGKRIILATSKPELHSGKILKLFDLKKYFDFAEGASLDSSRERKCDVLEYALSNVGITTADDKRGVIMVGDTKYDIEGARICGVDSLGVLYGYGKREELVAEGATYIAESVEDIKKILL